MYLCVFAGPSQLDLVRVSVRLFFIPSCLLLSQGGVKKYPYPLYVWSPSGGWWCNPKAWKRNTMLAFLFGALACVPVFIISSKLEVCVWCVCVRVRARASMCLHALHSSLVLKELMCCVCGVQEKVRLFSLQRRPVPPYRHIPSQRWCKYAKVTSC